MSETASHSLRDALEQEILSGGFRPGDRLDEASLAARFSVSRTPVREALQGLAASGLVELRPRRGAFVREVSPRELLEFFETMGEYEASCARFAALRLDPEGAEALKRTLDACGAAADDTDRADHMDNYYYENQRFHAAIYTAAANGFLERQTIALRNRLKPFRRLQLRMRGRIAQSQDEHRAIAAAILAGNEEEAARRARAHVVVQGERFNVILASLDRPSSMAG